MADLMTLSLWVAGGLALLVLEWARRELKRG